MGKTIIFRGKRKDNSEWVCGDLIQIPCGVKFIVNNKFGACIDGNGNFINTEAPFVCEVIPDTVGQFTGLYDENDKEIFEGDIIKVIYDDGTEYTTEVCTYGGTLCVDVEGEDYDFTAIDFAVDIWEANCCEFEVIGNIHDNPELLEKKK